MPPDAANPLLKRLSHYVELTPVERGVIEGLERERRRLKSGERLVVETRASEEMFVLQAGWLFTSTLLEGGARQILRIHHPGDIVNIACIAWSRVTATITAATEGEVSVFQRHALSDIFAGHPRLAALLFGISTMDNVALSDRLKSLGRTDGRARISTLLLELLSRQQITDGIRPDTLDLFLSQSEIADAVGLTKVHVNRLLREMTETGLIEREGRHVRIPDKDALVRISGFVDRQAQLATDWYPQPEVVN
jgi:CRP/FNR family transcriptional regulator, anaerobic regulatory protein